MMRRTAILSVLTSVLALTAACGGGSDGGSGGSTETKVIDITISGSDVTPNGDTIDVAVNQPIELDVTSDSPGELHVHTAGDGQEFEYKAGQNTFTFKVDRPGVVPVESHTIDKTIVQLQVQ